MIGWKLQHHSSPISYIVPKENNKKKDKKNCKQPCSVMSLSCPDIRSILSLWFIPPADNNTVLLLLLLPVSKKLQKQSSDILIKI